MMPNAYSADSGAGDLPYGAFGEIFGNAVSEMDNLPTESLPVASQGRVWRLIACNGVQIMAGCQVQPDGLLRWRPLY